jgi:hypothetical protein
VEKYTGVERGLNAVDVRFVDGIINQGILPPRSQDPNEYDLYLWGILKDKLYSTNNRNEDNQKKNIQGLMSSISPGELQREVNNLFFKI